MGAVGNPPPFGKALPLSAGGIGKPSDARNRVTKTPAADGGVARSQDDSEERLTKRIHANGKEQAFTELG